MRARLLAVLLAFSMAAVAVFAVPLLHTTAANRTQLFASSRTADVTRFATLAQQAAVGGDPSRLIDEVRAHAELFGDDVVVVDAHRQPVVVTGMRVGEPDVMSAVDAALRNQPQPGPAELRPWSSGTALFAQPVGTGTRVVGAVVLRSSVTPAVRDIRLRWAAVLAGALLAALVCAALAAWLARWVLRPVTRLSDGVREVTGRGPGAQAPADVGPAELRGLTVAFNAMSVALAESARRQRELVADASHQLRTPMAALRLRVDALAAHVDDTDGYASAVRQLERLEALLAAMLALASADSTATALATGGTDADGADAVVMVAERLDAWHVAARAAGVELLSEPGGPDTAPVRCPESDLAQVLDVLLDNAIKYAGAGARVRCGCVAEDGWVRLRVTDNGPGVPEAELGKLTERFWRGRGRDTPGSGLGLAIADRLVTARGGTLRLALTAPSGLEVTVDLPGGRA